MRARQDTSGPALNILIKLMSMVSLTVAPLLGTYSEDFEVQAAIECAIPNAPYHTHHTAHASIAHVVERVGLSLSRVSQFWWYGLVPLTVAAILTFVLSSMNILTWDDPLADMLAAPAPSGKRAMV